MNLREEILKEHSKAQCDKIVQWVGHSQKRLDELFYLFCSDEYRVAQRASWPLSYCIIAHPGLIEKHFDTLLKNLQRSDIPGAVKRNTVRLLQEANIPEKYEGAIMNLCFDFVASPQEAIAVKAFSLTILGNLSERYTEIIPELKLLIEEQLPHQTAAFNSRPKQLEKKWGG